MMTTVVDNFSAPLRSPLLPQRPLTITMTIGCRNKKAPCRRIWDHNDVQKLKKDEKKRTLLALREWLWHTSMLILLDLWSLAVSVLSPKALLAV